MLGQVSIQLGSPASGDIGPPHHVQRRKDGKVSIQLGSPASGDTKRSLNRSAWLRTVSIQLGSPASGDGALRQSGPLASRVSIQLGSPASGDFHGLSLYCCIGINRFPFNWDPQRVGTFPLSSLRSHFDAVSIQLGSPASGDLFWYNLSGCQISGFHSIGIPSEWGR